MAKHQTPYEAYRQGGQLRARYPLRLAGNSYKFLESIANLKGLLRTARNALSYELGPKKGHPDMLLDGGYLCLASERHWVVAKILRETLAMELSYNTLPGIELMHRPDLLKTLTSEVLENTLPASAAGLSLPKGAPMMEHLIKVLEGVLKHAEAALAELEVHHG